MQLTKTTKPVRISCFREEIRTRELPLRYSTAISGQIMVHKGNAFQNLVQNLSSSSQRKLLRAVNTHDEMGRTCSTRKRDKSWVTYQVLTAANMKMYVFWYSAPRSLTKTDRCFRNSCCIHYQGDIPDGENIHHWYVCKQDVPSQDTVIFWQTCFTSQYRYAKVYSKSHSHRRKSPKKSPCIPYFGTRLRQVASFTFQPL